LFKHGEKVPNQAKPFSRRSVFIASQLLMLFAGTWSPVTVAAVPISLRHWLTPQVWHRDTQGPILTLGRPGQFDDRHIFAPAVVREDDRFLMFYCGSRGAVSQRVFRLGMAISHDGKQFEKRSNPVYEFRDQQRSVLTPTLLRDTDGRALRENGRLRMWFSSTMLTRRRPMTTATQQKHRGPP